jgi:hypothetical protein
MSRPPQTITNLYAWIATEADGGEGVPAVMVPYKGEPLMKPLLGTDMERVRSLRDDAVMLKQTSGARMRLCRFALVEEIEEV